MNSENRPDLTRSTPVNDFLEFYWLKEELIAFCQQHGLRTTGGKVEITQRIAYFLKTGKAPMEKSASRTTARGGSDSLRISLDAPLTTQYSNSERVRAFFESVIGSHFHFTVALMKFCRENPKKTFRDAVQFWKDEDEKKKEGHRTEIAGQFEYNQYIRDFMDANKAKGYSLQDAIQCWKKKRSMRGDNKYDPADIHFLSED